MQPDRLLTSIQREQARIAESLADEWQDFRSREAYIVENMVRASGNEIAYWFSKLIELGRESRAAKLFNELVQENGFDDVPDFTTGMSVDAGEMRVVWERDVIPAARALAAYLKEIKGLDFYRHASIHHESEHIVAPLYTVPWRWLDATTRTILIQCGALFGIGVTLLTYVAVDSSGRAGLFLGACVLLGVSSIGAFFWKRRRELKSLPR